MKKTDIIRAWKDAQFRNSLSEADRRTLPGHPAGVIELTDEALEDVIGGASGQSCAFLSCNHPILPPT